METSHAEKVIIIVEDTIPIAQLIKDALNDEPDYQVLIVTNGSEAMEVIRSVKTSLILMDLNLPGLNGMEIYKLLKEDENLASIPVIFLTASLQLEELDNQHIPYIRKPFDLDELLDRVAVICRLS